MAYNVGVNLSKKRALAFKDLSKAAQKRGGRRGFGRLGRFGLPLARRRPRWTDASGQASPHQAGLRRASPQGEEGTRRGRDQKAFLRASSYFGLSLREAAEVAVAPLCKGSWQPLG
jgi:hypothetical protein